MESLRGRLNRCSINTATLGHREPLAVTIDRIARAGFGGVAPWRHELDAANLQDIAKQIRALELTVTGYCRSTYFPAETAAERLAAIESNMRALQQAAEIGAQCFVLVVGGLPAGSRDLPVAREQVAEGIAALCDEAGRLGVRLAIEPLHPMYAADRSVINTIQQALMFCQTIEPDGTRVLGVAIDIYHCWWDPQLSESIQAAGEARRIFAYHVSDWLPNTRDMLLDRGMMGDGVVDLERIRNLVENAGYRGLVEVEIFSKERWWTTAPDEALQMCANRLQSVC
ncbi:sugar phosphate isomerase/epimerase family protein [Paraburkholderia domus]|uniref:sugar phosphate isomerase/epimerase family protein n=1 Tax=Paraburkholderia domus TaxID=2793075 RepID=UPI0019143F19|nr:sugar phosphate isomerase/epimerase family protein [Paraburkholderia domus]MBK5065876.1 sugar phosphate isomerase/epimerase [Burkholderia sp. R-70199]CAE6958967.1 hypothetical protein R70199_07164 [Paraburkholderia domus]